MSRYALSLAEPADDAELRVRMAENRMDGPIAVSFRREPSYFAGCRLQGDSAQVVKCVDQATGGIVGMGTRSTACAYVDGKPRRIGYLSDLRIAPDARGAVVLARGYRFLKSLHEADPVPFYTTVIYDGNAPAVGVLTGARAGLPLYIDWGRLLTPAIRLDRRVRVACPAGVSVERGTRDRLPGIVAFLNACQRDKQFAPVYRAADFDGGRFAELAPGDFFVALRGGRIVGTLAAWDQARLRQTHVERYSGALAWLRPAYNALARVARRQPLPGRGAQLRYIYLSCLATENNDVSLFRGLLGAALAALSRGRWQFAVAGLHENDPLAAALDDFPTIAAAGRLFVVHWPNETITLDPPQRRVPYLEAGCL